MFSRKFPTPVSAKAAMVMVALVAALDPTLAFADEAEFLTQDNANILWTVIAAILVMFMQAGFGCVEAGFTRAKSAGNILMKNFLDFSVGSICFFLFGFAIMFGLDAGGFFGTSGFALGGVADADLPWTYTFWFFQSVFAATAATIVSGGMAERTKFSSYVLVSIFVTGLIYPISGHWAWGSLWLGDDGAGWLETLGFCDFAGSSVVHSVGGWIALAGAMVLGPRLGKYTEDGKARAIPGHNIPLAALGVFILWFGWFGFNPGSTTTADDTIGMIAMNTSLAACAGVLGAMGMSWLRFGKPDISMTLNGALAGLVGITAGCATVSAGGSILIGLAAGLLVVLSIEFIDKVLRIDDPVGAASVHGVCGAWGTIACGLFNVDGGLFYGGGFGQLGVQLIGAGAFFVWAFGAGYVLMTAIKGVSGLRVDKDEELKGLDISEHGSESYNGFQLFSNE
ncbi:ammonium transporter [Pseudodesulfovibrio sp. F-1]|uniref:Ammonium transporter n=1 Tax=Pseudodesulfovibrio alkaliphilus TaxID=2661613 RepID=A0A7K1KRB8_9BACT|nr:ammonium transporter [Pseudodesulfovibrio alkaliphilus]MUM78627.1 ammonium transporter [Pseudodesulfovibrio alkaliphilus]